MLKDQDYMDSQGRYTVKKVRRGRQRYIPLSIVLNILFLMIFVFSAVMMSRCRSSQAVANPNRARRTDDGQLRHWTAMTAALSDPTARPAVRTQPKTSLLVWSLCLVRDCLLSWSQSFPLTSTPP
jgi:hypothetical protein